MVKQPNRIAGYTPTVPPHTHPLVPRSVQPASRFPSLTKLPIPTSTSPRSTSRRLTATTHQPQANSHYPIAAPYNSTSTTSGTERVRKSGRTNLEVHLGSLPAPRGRWRGCDATAVAIGPSLLRVLAGAAVGAGGRVATSERWSGIGFISGGK
jgi:hypothetical protein